MKWGWSCEAYWCGIGKSFQITIPVCHMGAVYLESMRYCPKYCQILIDGHFTGKNNIGTRYNDLTSSESTLDASRPPGDGGADGETQPNQPKESITQLS
jgi:hypothetical protein